VSGIQRDVVARRKFRLRIARPRRCGGVKDDRPVWRNGVGISSDSGAREAREELRVADARVQADECG